MYYYHFNFKLKKLLVYLILTNYLKISSGNYTNRRSDIRYHGEGSTDLDNDNVSS